jgi:aspartate-semialdehyde dehydrogenase
LLSQKQYVDAKKQVNEYEEIAKAKVKWKGCNIVKILAGHDGTDTTLREAEKDGFNVLQREGTRFTAIEFEPILSGVNGSTGPKV